MGTPDILWERELPVPRRHGKKLPIWAVKYFKEVWHQYSKKNLHKYTSPISFEIVREDEFDIIWRASRTCKPKYARAVPLALREEEGRAPRRFKRLLAESHDERARLDLLAGHKVVLVSPLRGGGVIGDPYGSAGEPQQVHDDRESQA